MWVKVEGWLGPGPKEQREVLCVNKIFRYCVGTAGSSDATEIEADPRHVEILQHQLALAPESKGV
eukprot:4166932-Amphidinium_carterae.1